VRRTRALLTAAVATVSLLTGAAPVAAHPAAGPRPMTGQQTVLAYYVSDNGQALHVVAEPRPVQRTKAPARAAIGEALEKPYGRGLATMAPKGTRLLDVNLKNRVLVVNLSQQVKRNPGVGGAGEDAFAQQLAHTATQFPTIGAVRLHVEGKPVQTLWGHRDWSHPVLTDTSRIAG
jgi:spore germination protein GerM